MRTIHIPTLFALALLTMHCGGEKKTTEGESESSQETSMVSEGLAITPFSASQSYPEAKLTNMSFKDGTFQFGVENYELKAQTPDATSKMCANSAKGQHIHLIVDDQPYAAKYESSFSYEIPDGEHYVLAFLSRSYHESIKNGMAHIAQKVMVTDNSFSSAEDITQPMLFYSRPKGTYVGESETQKVMLDYFLVNVDPNAGYVVKADINGETQTFDRWQPYYLEGLPMGENTITLTLLGPDGQPVDHPNNPVSRTFNLKADELEQ